MNQNPYQENLENVLEKYGRNIVDAAKNGKIDPVIGRDEEIRSITRILSRKYCSRLLIAQITPFSRP